MNTYYLKVAGKDECTAGVKAPDDITKLLDRRGYKPIPFLDNKRYKSTFLTEIAGRAVNSINWARAFVRIKVNSILFIQYPYRISAAAWHGIRYLKKMKKTTIILLLHDVDSIRLYNINRNEKRERIFGLADYLICHNESMEDYLVGKGIQREQLYILGVFDYLCEKEPKANIVSEEELEKSVIIAGNLGKRKSPYIYKLLESEREYTVNLYGPNYEPDGFVTNVAYKGCFPPDELPSILQGTFGLVWDGDKTHTCAGATGNYLRYNNPHKVSLYLASGIPVIIWKKAALAQYIEDNGLGIAVESLTEINNIFGDITVQAYREMKHNVVKEGYRIRNGFYFDRVMGLIEKEIGL